jgi:tetratricopeptide (TPR) repeat protein
MFAAGFIGGILFSAWKLDRADAPKSPMPPSGQPRQEPLGQEKLAAMEKMAEARPGDPDALIQLGNAYFDSGNHQKAVETYQKALQINPSNPDVLTDMGISFRKLGKPDEAIARFKQAHAVDPNHPLALFNMGIVYRDDLKNLPEALVAWETFLKKAPDSPYAVMVRPWVKQIRDQIDASGKSGKQ